jgi:hypothetical protein
MRYVYTVPILGRFVKGQDVKEQDDINRKPWSVIQGGCEGEKQPVVGGVV